MDIFTAIVVLKKYSEREVRFERDRAFVKVFVQVGEDAFEPLGWIERSSLESLVREGMLSAEELGDKTND